jgi:acetyl-CoA synthetase
LDIGSRQGADAPDRKRRREMAEDTNIQSLMTEERVIQPPDWVREKAYIKTMDEYEAMYKRSIDDMEGFWAEMAEEHVYWEKKWDKVLDYDFEKPYIKWFVGGKTNVAYNCLDRHLTTWRRNKAALFWESDEGRT